MDELIFLELYPTFLQKFNIKKRNIKTSSLNLTFKENQEFKEENTYSENGTDNKEKSNQSNNKDNAKSLWKNNKRKLTLGIVILSVIVLIINKQLIYKIFFYPKPEITFSDASSETSLFDYSTKVTGTVVNKGGDGYIIIKAFVYQNDNKYEKSKQLYLLSDESQDFEFLFKEVKFLAKSPTYNVKTYSLGNQ